MFMRIAVTDPVLRENPAEAAPKTRITLSM